MINYSICSKGSRKRGFYLSIAMLVLTVCYLSLKAFCDEANYSHRKFIPVYYHDFAIF